MSATAEQPATVIPAMGEQAESSGIAKVETPKAAVEDTASSQAVPVKPAQDVPTLTKIASIPEETHLSEFFALLPGITKDADHTEMWGVELKADANHVPTSIVLEKFLRANKQDMSKAKTQLIDALNWRRETQPAKLLAETEFDNEKFGNLGYVTVHEPCLKYSSPKEVITWNVYGAVKDKKKTFGDVDE